MKFKVVVLSPPKIIAPLSLLSKHNTGIADQVLCHCCTEPGDNRFAVLFSKPVLVLPRFK